MLFVAPSSSIAGRQLMMWLDGSVILQYLLLRFGRLNLNFFCSATLERGSWCSNSESDASWSLLTTSHRSCLGLLEVQSAFLDVMGQCFLHTYLSRWGLRYDLCKSIDLFGEFSNSAQMIGVSSTDDWGVLIFSFVRCTYNCPHLPLKEEFVGLTGPQIVCSAWLIGKT